MNPQKPARWAGEPNAREMELERKLEEIDRKYQMVGLTEAERIEGVRLHLDLLEESQRRSGVTLFKITRNAADDGAIYDLSNFKRVNKDIQMLIRAGMPMENAVARALADERQRQQREAAEAEAEVKPERASFARRVINLVKLVYPKGATSCRP